MDVFAERALEGNALAVFHDGRGLTDAEMQALARETNLSETTFLLPPTAVGADYRVRIFTLDRELPFAGHPTLGSCHAWLEAGGAPRTPGEVIQECGAGLIPIRREPGALAFAAPPVLRAGTLEREKLAEVLDFLRLSPAKVIEARWIDNGPGWMGILLDSAEAVLAVDAARSHPGRIEVGLVGPHPAGAPCAFEIRALFSDQHGGVREDPVTGSLNASVAQWLFETGRATGAYRAAQGTKIGYEGRIRLRQDTAGAVWVGGATRTMFVGKMAD